MQALFYIGLFGTFFFVMSGITMGVARNTFQKQLDRQERIVEIFSDLEYAINRVLLRSELSLASESMDNLDYVMPHMSWSTDDVTTDPWARPIVVGRIDNSEVIAAFGPGEQAVANVSYFTLISGGPDREVQTDVPADVIEWRTLHSVGGEGDDIVHTFSTRDPMIETWNAAVEAENNVADVMVRNYRQRVEAYNTATGETISDFVSCALLDQTGNQNNLDCSPSRFTSEVIHECNRLYNYSVEVKEAKENNQSTSNMKRPTTTRIPNDVDVDVSQCWRYDPQLKNDSKFPSMAGSAGTTGQRPCRNSNDCTVAAVDMGADTAMLRDPFGGFRLKYDDEYPDQIILERNLQLDGWRVVRQHVIRAE